MPWQTALPLLAGFRLRQDDVVGEVDRVRRIAARPAGDDDREAVDHRLQRPRRRVRHAVDLLALERRHHGVAFERGDAQLVRLDAAAGGDREQIGMRIGVDRADAEGLAAQHRGALFQRRLGVEARGLRGLLAHGDGDDVALGGVGDGEQPLAARGGARQRRAAGLHEIGAAGDHRVGRADALDLDDLHPQAVLGPEPQFVGDEIRRRGEGEVRHRDDDVLQRRAAPRAAPP